MYLFCYALLCFHSSFAITLKRNRKLVALLLLSYRCIVTINVLCLFLTVSWVGLHCVIVVFPDHTHLIFNVKLLFQIMAFKLPRKANLSKHRRMIVLTGINIANKGNMYEES